MDNGAPINIGGAAVIGNGNGFIVAPVNFVQATGSVINISGGYLTYTPGFVRVSTLLDVYGRRVSVSNANADADYLGTCCAFTVSHARWGVTDIYSSALRSSGYEQSGYVQGGAAGSLTVAADTAVFGGTLVASVVAGIKQQTPATAPIGASLTVNSTGITTAFGQQYTTYNAEDVTLSDDATASALQRIAGFNVQTDLATLLSPGSVTIRSSWLNTGLANVALGANDKVSLPAGNDIVMPAGGSLALSANTVDIASSIIIPGGTLTLTAAYTRTSAAVNGNLTPNAADILVGRSGLVSIASGATLSTAGLWTRVSADSAFLAPNGGTITINSDYGDIDLGHGSVLDVSAGAYEKSTGAITSGNGGTLTLAAGLVPNHGLNDPSVSIGQINFGGSSLGSLQQGQLRGYGIVGSTGIGNGGTLNIRDTVVATILPATQVGDALASQLPQAVDDVGNAYSSLALSTAFFSSGGFAKVNFTASGISLPAGVTLAPTVGSLVIANAAPSATSVGAIATPFLCRQGSGRLPRSLCTPPVIW